MFIPVYVMLDFIVLYWYCYAGTSSSSDSFSVEVAVLMRLYGTYRSPTADRMYCLVTQRKSHVLHGVQSLLTL